MNNLHRINRKFERMMMTNPNELRTPKFYPILFSTEMVKAILAGTKSCTRRIIKIQPQGEPRPISEWNKHVTGSDRIEYENRIRGKIFPFYNGRSLSGPSSRYGYEGDILWCRETWCLTQPYNPEDYYFGYKAYNILGPHSSEKASDKYRYQSPDIWKPSIHMPKEACRLFLQNRSISVERLNDISEQDAIREGIIWYEEHGIKRFKDYMADASGYGDPDVDYPTVSSAVESYKTLWESINGKGSWEINPWVWCINFNRIIKPDNFA